MSLRLLCCSGSLDGGGSERQLWQLACHLESGRFDRQLYLLYRRGHYLDQLPANLPVHAFSDLDFQSRIPGAIHRAQVRHLASLIKDRQIDLVYDRTFHMTLVTSKACRRADVPRVSVIVSPPSRDFARSEERFRWFKYRALRKAYSDPAATTIAVSQAVAEDAASFYQIPIKRLRIVESPVDIESVQRSAVENRTNDILSPRSCDSSPLRLVVVGRMTAEKGHDLMLQATHLWNKTNEFAAMRKIQLNFVGDGPLRSQLESQADRLGIADCVQFCGFQTNPYPWIAQADILCIPSQYEGLPNVALEAMALKKPIIVTPCSESLLRLVGVGNQRGILLDQSSPSSFVDALKAYLENPAAAADRAELAYAWVSQNHSLKSWIDLMSQLLESAKRG